jgi:hypothetical protein
MTYLAVSDADIFALPTLPHSLREHKSTCTPKRVMDKLTTDAMKWQILTMKSLDMARSLVAKVVGDDRTTVNCVHRHYGKPRPSYPQPLRSGRPRKMLQSDDCYAALALTRAKFGNAAQIQCEYFPDLHPKIIRRHLRELGLMARKGHKVLLLTYKHRRAGRTWAVEHRLWEAIDWARIIFSDESQFNSFATDGP